MHRGRAGLLAALLALAAGCGTAPAPSPTPAPVLDRWPGCVPVGAFASPYGAAAPSPTGAIPAGFVATQAVLCERTSYDSASTIDLERTATDIGPLLTYLALPGERATDGACPAIGWIRPWLFLLDADGRYVAPAIPTDGCGLPLNGVGDQAAWLTLDYHDRVVGRG